tara:strand:- start:264 stop:890 length:627 start_codon:yes stop_codon:yes gene_type:complete
MQHKITGLKKEFKRKDVERMRNLIRGKAGDSSEQQVGYTKKRVDRKEGDIWTEGHKTWTIKNGIKQTISKLDKIRKETVMPLCCPQCSNVMKKHLDKSCFKTHKKCLDCVVEDRKKLVNKERLTNTYDPTKNFHKVNRKNQLMADIARINDLEASYIEKITNSKSNYISEQGDVERWVGNSNTESLIKEIKETAKTMREKFNKELKSL